jgi:hypothetical protein
MYKAFFNRFKIIPFKSNYVIEKDDKTFGNEEWKKYNCKAFHDGQSTFCGGDITNFKLKCSKCYSSICLNCEKLIQNKNYDNIIIIYQFLTFDKNSFCVNIIANFKFLEIFSAKLSFLSTKNTYIFSFSFNFSTSYIPL